MTLLTLFMLAFGMSMDAFAVSIGKGVTLKSPHYREALRIGFIFGLIEGITPLIGWSAGQVASRYIGQWDHWIAFIMLGFLGGKMILEGSRGDLQPEETKPDSIWLLMMTAIATSIDAMAIGVSLAFLQVNILQTALCIGLTTCLMSTSGILLGRHFGQRLGKRSEIIGGLVLIGIGCHLLYSSLF